MPETTACRCARSVFRFMTEILFDSAAARCGLYPRPPSPKVIDQAALCHIRVKTALLPQRQQLGEAAILKAFNASSTRCEDNEGAGAERLSRTGKARCHVQPAPRRNHTVPIEAPPTIAPIV